MGTAVRQARPATKKSSGTSRGRASERAHRIAEAAYYLAQQRGFSGGDPVQDWLEAERIIDAGPTASRRRKKGA